MVSVWHSTRVVVPFPNLDTSIALLLLHLLVIWVIQKRLKKRRGEEERNLMRNSRDGGLNKAGKKTRAHLLLLLVSLLDYRGCPGGGITRGRRRESHLLLLRISRRRSVTCRAARETRDLVQT